MHIILLAFFSVLFNCLFIYYSFWRVYINNLKVWGTLMQFCHNERNFLGYIWNLNDPQLLFQNLLSKNYWWKNTLSLSKVLMFHEIETYTKEVHLKFEDDLIIMTLSTDLEDRHYWQVCLFLLLLFKIPRRYLIRKYFLCEKSVRAFIISF